MFPDGLTIHWNILPTHTGQFDQMQSYFILHLCKSSAQFENSCKDIVRTNHWIYLRGLRSPHTWIYRRLFGWTATFGSRTSFLLLSTKKLALGFFLGRGVHHPLVNNRYERVSPACGCWNSYAPNVADVVISELGDRGTRYPRARLLSVFSSLLCLLKALHALGEL